MALHSQPTHSTLALSSPFYPYLCPMEQQNTIPRILVFIDWYLPGYKAGGGQRAFANFVAYMRQEAEFYIVTRDTDFLETTPYKGIFPNQWNKRGHREQVWYCSAKTEGLQLYRALYHEVKPDIVYVNGVYSWKYSILPLVLCKLMGFKGLVLQGTYGMLASTAIQIKSTKKKLFLFLAQWTGLYKKVTFHATSENEKADIIRVFGTQTSIRLAPHFPEMREIHNTPLQKVSGKLKMVSVARIAPEKNTLYALEVLAILPTFEGEIVFDLYGPIYDEPYWQECQKKMKQLPANILVNYSGLLKSKEVISKIAGYHLFFMPTQGENFGYAILESFMAGRPVIISNRTPWQNLKVKKAGYDLPLDKMANFSNVIMQALNQEQHAFNEWSAGAGSVANDFIRNPQLKEINMKLLSNIR